MAYPEKSYLSYLLRLWRVQTQDQPVWRCSLENVQTGERHGFSNLKALCEFLDETITFLPEDDYPKDASAE